MELEIGRRTEEDPYMEEQTPLPSEHELRQLEEQWEGWQQNQRQVRQMALGMLQLYGEMLPKVRKIVYDRLVGNVKLQHTQFSPAIVLNMAEKDTELLTTWAVQDNQGYDKKYITKLSGTNPEKVKSFEDSTFTKLSWRHQVNKVGTMEAKVVVVWAGAEVALVSIMDNDDCALWNGSRKANGKEYCNKLGFIATNTVLPNGRVPEGSCQLEDWESTTYEVAKKWGGIWGVDIYGKMSQQLMEGDIIMARMTAMDKYGEARTRIPNFPQVISPRIQPTLFVTKGKFVSRQFVRQHFWYCHESHYGGPSPKRFALQKQRR